MESTPRIVPENSIKEQTRGSTHQPVVPFCRLKEPKLDSLAAVPCGPHARRGPYVSSDVHFWFGFPIPGPMLIELVFGGAMFWGTWACFSR